MKAVGGRRTFCSMASLMRFCEKVCINACSSARFFSAEGFLFSLSSD